jgi:peroxiredoxin
MTIKTGDSIPAMKVMQGTSEGPKELDTAEFFKGRTVVLFGVPGAFTPTCSAKHLPGFTEHAADGSAAFTKAMGLEFDLTARGLGVRCQRFALVAKDGKVTHVAVEAPGAFEVSKAEAVLAAL